MTLQTILEIRKDGLEAVVKRYNLRVRKYPTKICLKYDQLNSPMHETVVTECRGLVLSWPGLNVYSYAFKKFFNHGESKADIIDWDTASIQEKCDGTMIHVYFDWDLNKWQAGTTGTAEGESEVPGKLTQSFSELFWEVLDRTNPEAKSLLFPGLTYVFELMTPLNVVVVRHETYKIKLLTIRDLNRLVELPISAVDSIAEQMKIDRPILYKASNIDELLEMAKALPKEEEGYVVVDENYNRIKIKGLEYYIAHRMIDGMNSVRNLVELIITGEQDELLAYFPTMKPRLDVIEEKINEKIQILEKFQIEYQNQAIECFVLVKAFGKENAEYKALNHKFYNSASNLKGLDKTFVMLLVFNPWRSAKEFVYGLEARAIVNHLKLKDL